MKRLKITGLLLIFTVIASFAANAQNAKFKNWVITSSQSGGFAGINKSFTLDSEGSLNRKNRGVENFRKIDQAKINEIEKLIRELKLPGTKSKTFKGKKIYDGIYTSLIITLDGKEYKVEGNSFEDAKFLALSGKQKLTLEKLKAKLAELDGFLPDSMNN